MIVQIREAIQASGLTISELARLSEVSHPQISRFMHGERTLTLPAAAKVCEALGLRLVGPETGARPARAAKLVPATQPHPPSSPERPAGAKKPGRKAKGK